MKKYFGTDGIRGKIGDDKMRPEFATLLGKVAADFCRLRKERVKILIGMDTRESGAVLSEALAKAIISSGGSAVLAGIIPTPGLAFLTKAGDFSLGIMISASHNDSSYNGFKLFNKEGDKLNDAEEEEMEKLIDDLSGIVSRDGNLRAKAGQTELMEDALDKYIQGLFKALPENFSASGIKIVLDCANGATFEVAPLVFKKIGVEIIAICNQPDGKNINDNCGSQHPEKLKAEVIKNGAQLGLAFDGDGDRVIAVDEKGNILNGDQLLFIFAKMLKEKGELGEIVVSTQMSNLGFVRALEKMGVGHIYTGVGDREVYEEMKRSDAVLGGEESGHIIFRSFLSNGDGILSGLKLIEAMQFFKKPLSELAEGIEFYPKILLNISAKSKPELSGFPEIENEIKAAEKALGVNGRVVVRYSGTENLCRVMVEGREKREVENYSSRIASIIEKELNN